MSTLKANSYQHVDRASPSIIINSDGSVSISSTVTYEDITSVDSVGVITGRSNADLQNRVNVGSGVSIKAGGLNVTAGISTFGGTSTFNDDVTFTGASYSVAWDKSQNSLEFADNTRLTVGDGRDYQLYHDGTYTWALDNSSGGLHQKANKFVWQAYDDAENMAIFHEDGACRFYFDGTERLATTNTGITVYDNLNVAGVSTFVGNVSIADKIIHTGDTNTAIRFPAADTITAETGGSERVRVTSAGSVGVGTDNPNRKFTLYNDTTTRMNIKSLATSTTGIEFGDPADENIGYIVYDNTDDSMQFGVNTSEALRINSSGQAIFKSDGSASQGSIGIEAGDPFIRLYDTNGTANNRKWDIRNVGAGSYLQFRTVNDANDTFSTKVVIDTSGLVGIGTINPTLALLHIGPASYSLNLQNNSSNESKILFTKNTNAGDSRAWIKGNGELTGYLKFGAGDADRLTINSSGNANFAGIATATNFASSTVPTSHRNRFINGDMTVSQRYLAAETTINVNAWHYILDRWKMYQNTDGAATVTQVTSGYNATNTGSGDALRIKVTTADTSLSGTQQLQLTQVIEGFNWEDMRFGTSNAKSFTVSFSILATGASSGNVTGTYCVNATNFGDYDRSYVKEYTIDAVDVWKRVTLTFPGCTDGTWGTGANGCMRMGWFFAGPTSQQGAANQWHSSYKGSTSNQKNGMGVVNNFYFIKDIQVEEGTVASAYEKRSRTEELARCQRYFYKPPINNNLQPAYQYHSGYKMTFVPFPVSMRATPTSTVTWGTAGTFTHYNPNTDHFKAYVASDYDEVEAFYITAFETTAEL